MVYHELLEEHNAAAYRKTTESRLVREEGEILLELSAHDSTEIGEVGLRLT